MRNLIEIAESILELAGEEARQGYESKDDRRIRDAAQKVWLAVIQATDHAMWAHGKVPEPGAGAHAARHEFLEAIGRRDLSKELSYFADRLHGDCFYYGSCPSRDCMEAALQEARQYIERIKET